MLPQSPVVEGLEPYEIMLGENQEEYLPLPVLRSPAPWYATMSRWEPSPEERKLIAEGADIFLTLYTFGNGYPPTRVEVMRATADAELIRERMQLDDELEQRLRAVYAASAAAQPLTPSGESHAQPNPE